MIKSKLAFECIKNPYLLPEQQYLNHSKTLKIQIMTRFPKQLSFLVSLCFAVFIFSCNSSADQKADAAKPADTPAVAATPTPPPPPPFKPFDVAEISHKVKDYAKWRPGFNADSPNRKAAGLDFIALGRGVADSNNVLIALQVNDMAKAKAFAADPRLADLMKKNGVVSKPDIAYYHVEWINMNSHEKQWVLVTHKVKDYAAWKKVFDAEGADKRKSFGLVDVVISRSLADSNTVHLVFDISDMAKAKARMNDPELKKVMTDAGVIGAPKIEWFNAAD